MAKKNKKQNVDWAEYERQAQKRSAWGHYAAQMSYIRAEEREEKFQKELNNATSQEDKDRVRKKKKDEDDNFLNMLIIS